MGQQATFCTAEKTARLFAHKQRGRLRFRVLMHRQIVAGEH
jgi:hypothetical protein